MKNKIQINQLGYFTTGHKTASYVGKAPSHFSILDEKSQVVYVGEISAGVDDLSSKETVHSINFSNMCKDGRYIIKAGTTKSKPFYISDNPYDDLFGSSLKYYYISRCGIDLLQQYAGRYSRGRCHTEKACLLSDELTTKNVSGGWHDAGDFGKYVVTGCAAVATLLYSYTLYKDAFDVDLNIPHEYNCMPDILEECLYELKFLLKMQDRDGGVYHKVSTKKYPPTVMPEDDIEQQYIYDKTTSATADFCAVMALAARVYRNYCKEMYERFKKAAINAWAWLLNNPAIKPSGNIDRFLTVEYTDRNIDDDIFWAACELYSLTGDKSFHNKISDTFYKVDTTAFSWLSLGGFGAISYILGDVEKDPTILDNFKSSFIFKSENIINMINHTGFNVANNGTRYLWGSNMQILTKGIVLAISDLIQPQEDYRDYIQMQLDYVLGKNPMGKCYVTGFGNNPVLHPHHRHSTADDIAEPVPGMLVGGPDMLRSDECARWMIPQGTPPAKCYCDESHCYSCNEPSIYFNACEIFTLAVLKNYYERGNKNDH